MAQGKAFDKETVIESLKPYFLLGYNRTKACMFVGVDNSTLSKWESEDPSLSTKINAWINTVNAKARQNIVTRIHNGEIDDSWKWIEKTDRDFSSKTETELSGGLTIKIVEDKHE